jgi:predicted dehydrogenase
VSQVAAGRKNRLTWEVDGAESALAWDSESPEYLWAGHRGRPNEVMNKDAAVMMPAGAEAAAYPPGHVEGYPDSFRALFAAVYADIDAGHASPAPVYPTFADGHDAMLVCDAVAASARTGTWTTIRRSS